VFRLGIQAGGLALVPALQLGRLSMEPSCFAVPRGLVALQLRESLIASFAGLLFGLPLPLLSPRLPFGGSLRSRALAIRSLFGGRSFHKRLIATRMPVLTGNGQTRRCCPLRAFASSRPTLISARS
jgi:hypothetical protein